MRGLTLLVVTVALAGCANFSYRSLAEEALGKPKSGAKSEDIAGYLDEFPFAYLLVERPGRLGTAFIMVDTANGAERWMDAAGNLLFREGVFSLSSSGVTGLNVATLDSDLPNRDDVRQLIDGQVDALSGVRIVEVLGALDEQRIEFVYVGAAPVAVNDLWVQTHQIEERVVDARGNRWVNTHALLVDTLYNVRSRAKYSAEDSHTVIQLYKAPGR